MINYKVYYYSGKVTEDFEFGHKSQSPKIEKNSKWPKIKQSLILGQNWSKNIENGAINISNLSFKPKSIYRSVKTCQNLQK